MPKKIDLNFDKIKELWDQGLTCPKIAKNLGVCRDIIYKYLKNNNLIPNKMDHHNVSEETRKKISEFRKKYLKENPDKHPWRNNNKFKSKPCEKIKDWLKSKEINFIGEYVNHGVKDKNYSIDIAFPDKMIGIEINGNQHYNNDGTLKPYYREREKLLIKTGWKIYQIHYSLCYKIEEFEKLFNDIINCTNIFQFNYENYVKEKMKKKEYKCIDCKYDISKNANRCLKCNTKYRNTFPIEYTKPRNYNNYNRKKNKIRYFCLNCGVELLNKCKRCISCYRLLSRKVKIRPTKEELQNLIKIIPMTRIGKQFGVSDNAIRKWCKYYGISIRNRT